jgi:DNA end-binding protein Ku
MPKAVWKGSISFGLVNIPISLYTATKEKQISFKLIHSKCKGPIKYQRFCEKCNEVVPWDEVAKGYEYKKGQFVILEKEDFERIPIKTAKTIEILGFVKPGEIDPIYFESSYQIAPVEGGGEAYILLRDVMAELERIAIGKITIHEKEHLVAIRNYQDILILHTMHWPDEIKLVEFEIPKVKISKEEFEIAAQLIEKKIKAFNPEEYKDEYREALLELIKAKIEEKPLPPAKIEIKKAQDLMELLKKSLEEEKKKKKEK